MKYEEALKKPFTDFKKLAIGIVLSIVPIVNFTIVQGFAIESSGVGKAKPSKNMPEWKDWSYLFVKGIGATLVKLIYALPALALMGFGIGIAVGDMMGMMANNLSPELTGQMMGGGFAANEQIVQVLAQNWYMVLPGMMKAAPLMMVGGVLALLASFLAPVAVLNYLSKKDFSAAFDLGKVMHKAFNTRYALAWITMLLVSVVLVAVLRFVPWFGGAIALFALSVMSYTLYGQAFKETK
ncbi:MAG: DUF4013 domain-containing protein [Candidatus Aenigmatarchaeota archaeon]